jgi:uncharacterized protein (DUF433 family)
MTPYPHITHTEGICGGRARIEGTRIEVANIAAYMKQGISLEEIAEYYPAVQPASILAAAAYYLDNREEIEATIQAQQQLYETGYAAQYGKHSEAAA